MKCSFPGQSRFARQYWLCITWRQVPHLRIIFRKSELSLCKVGTIRPKSQSRSGCHCWSVGAINANVKLRLDEGKIKITYNFPEYLVRVNNLNNHSSMCNNAVNLSLDEKMWVMRRGNYWTRIYIGGLVSVSRVRMIKQLLLAEWGLSWGSAKLTKMG